jgi:hypothetical protein
LTVGSDPDAVPVVLSEEDIRKQYPLDYRALTDKLRSRYSDFKENAEYHKIRKRLARDERYARTRYLDPGNPRSGKKDFYSSNALSVFDGHYTRRRK